MVRQKQELTMISFGYSRIQMQNTMERFYGTSKQLLTEDIQRMIRNKWIVDENPDLNKYKYYHLTESGRTVLAGYVKGDHARLVKLENIRHKSIAKNTVYLNRFLSTESYNFEPRKTLHNVKTYYGKVNNITMQVIVSKKQTSFIFTPPPRFDLTKKKAKLVLQDSILDIVHILNREWLFDLTPPIALRGGQVALGGELPKLLLERNNGAQIRVEKDYGIVTVDASPPDKIPQLEEPYDGPDILDKILDMPDQMIDLENRITKAMERIQSSDKKYEMQQYLLERIVTSVEKDSKNIDLLREAVTKLTGEVKTGKEEVKQPTMSKDAEKMFW